MFMFTWESPVWGVCVPESLVRTQLECSMALHWTLHSGFAVLKCAHRGKLQLRQELNQSLESWSCDPAILLPILV